MSSAKVRLNFNANDFKFTLIVPAEKKIGDLFGLIEDKYEASKNSKITVNAIENGQGYAQDPTYKVGDAFKDGEEVVANSANGGKPLPPVPGASVTAKADSDSDDDSDDDSSDDDSDDDDAAAKPAGLDASEIPGPPPPPGGSPSAERGKKRKKDPKKPVKPANTFVMYLNANAPQYRLDNENCSYAAARTALSETWKGLDEGSKEEFKTKYAEAKAAYDLAMQSYVPAPGSEFEADEKAESTKKKQKTKKDGNAPKRPKTAYLLFGDDNRGKVKEAHPDWKQSQIMTELGALWKKCPESTKAELNQRATALKDAYDTEVAVYKTSDSARAFAEKAAAPPPAPPPMAASASAASDAAATLVEVSKVAKSDDLKKKNYALLKKLVKKGGGASEYKDDKEKQKTLLKEFNTQSSGSDKAFKWIKKKLKKLNEKAADKK